ncbi:glycine-rich RNA-binding protein 2 [Euphorbia peplus]|nr:glycine-rich RNA-binding protein 2 [Euphorbia peplus]
MQCWNYCSVHLSKSASLLYRSSWPRFSSSSSQLFVGGLSCDTNETVLKDAFQQHGEITEVRIICDRVSGESKGYGFVKFDSEATASTALNQMNGQVVDGRTIRVSYAHKGSFLKALQCDEEKARTLSSESNQIDILDIVVNSGGKLREVVSDKGYCSSYQQRNEDPRWPGDQSFTTKFP